MNRYMKEMFLPLSGIEGCSVLNEKYRISNYSRVFNLQTLEFCKLSLCGVPKYHYITLTHKGVRGTYRVHRLSALSFVPNPDNKPIVDHKDRDRLNNYVDNFRWCTKSENQMNSYRVDFARGTREEKIRIAKERELLRERSKYVHDHIKEKIRYLWRHEYATKKDLSMRYKISVDKINKILGDIEPKKRKPKFHIFY